MRPVFGFDSVVRRALTAATSSAPAPLLRLHVRRGVAAALVAAGGALVLRRMLQVNPHLGTSPLQTLCPAAL